MISENKLAGEVDDPIVADALRHFKSSVDYWSEAAYSQPRTARLGTQLKWRMAASWALGCLLAAASVAGTLYEHHAGREAARIAAIKAAEQKAARQQKVAERPVTATVVPGQPVVVVKAGAKEDENLLATVDSDVSRQVPAAMEPLAQLMDTGGAN
ncbi:MAG TPA: hypothetical protein VMT38_13315 [Terracidiphilus sp.]|nr:hypothetical protein [Terracidiphilus sp.]